MITKNYKAKCVFLISTVGLALNSSAAVSTQYDATRASCARHRQPEWFQDAKFGLYAHWGPRQFLWEEAPSGGVLWDLQEGYTPGRGVLRVVEEPLGRSQGRWDEGYHRPVEPAPF